MAQAQPSPTIENYLSLMFVLERDGEPVVGARLAELLGVTPPTVTNTLKRMARDGLVILDDPQGPRLTEGGLKAAHTVMRRHMLTEWMLARMLSWSKSHGQAHHLEHAISDEIEAALVKEWGDPKTCPHGNPLPGHEAVVADWVPLTGIPVGQTVTIRRVHELAEETPGLLAFLEEKGILPGCQATVTEVLPFNQTISLQVGGGWRRWVLPRRAICSWKCKQRGPSLPGLRRTTLASLPIFNFQPATYNGSKRAVKCRSSLGAYVNL